MNQKMRGQSRVGDLEFLHDHLRNAVLLVKDISLPAFREEIRTELLDCSAYVEKAEEQVKKLWELREPLIEARLSRIKDHIEEEKVRLVSKKREYDLSTSILDITTNYFYPDIAAAAVPLGNDPVHPLIREKMRKTKVVGIVMEFLADRGAVRDVFIPVRICSKAFIDGKGTKQIICELLGFTDVHSVKTIPTANLSQCREGNPEFWSLWKEGMPVHVKMYSRKLDGRDLDGMLHESGVWVKAVILSVNADQCIVRIPDWTTSDKYTQHIIQKDRAADLRTSTK